jgi:hypothetical protein
MAKRAFTEDEVDTTSKRSKTTTFNPLALQKMGYTFDISPVLTRLCTKKASQLWQFGVAIGNMLYYIPHIVSTYLDNAVDYASKVPDALTWATGYVEQLDKYIAYLRLTDGLSEKFPSDARKSKAKATKYLERYVYMVEAVFKNVVKEGWRMCLIAGARMRRGCLIRASIKLCLAYNGVCIRRKMLSLKPGRVTGRFGFAASVRSWAWMRRGRGGRCWRRCR